MLLDGLERDALDARPASEFVVVVYEAFILLMFKFGLGSSQLRRRRLMQSAVRNSLIKDAFVGLYYVLGYRDLVIPLFLQCFVELPHLALGLEAHGLVSIIDR